MKKIGEWIVKYRVFIFIASLLLLIPSAIGYFNTRVNYDILSYLPKDIETKNQFVYFKKTNGKNYLYKIDNSVKILNAPENMY